MWVSTFDIAAFAKRCPDRGQVASTALGILTVGKATGPDTAKCQDLFHQGMTLTKIAAAGKPVYDFAELAWQVNKVADRACRLGAK